MKYAIQLLDQVGEVESVTGIPAWGYVHTYDPHAFNGRGAMTSTHDIQKALHFDSLAEAIEFWKQDSGVRADGKPNRPLTVFTVTIVPVPPSD